VSASELDEMAAEELDRARTLRWRELVKVIPWGDTHDAFAPSGRAVSVERNYLWAAEPGGDILCEVAVYPNTVLYDYAARRSCLIRKEAR
jgi:hypothetical protein